MNADSEIRRQIERYLQSVDGADTGLAATIWSTTPDASFIHPRGHERGWDEIAQNFYGKTMGESFTKRALKVVGDVTVHVFGTAAVAEFNWEFNAMRRDTGKPLRSSGRESQVYVERPGEGWRLIHVHYSGPPTTAAGRGF